MSLRYGGQVDALERFSERHSQDVCGCERGVAGYLLEELIRTKVKALLSIGDNLRALGERWVINSDRMSSIGTIHGRKRQCSMDVTACERMLTHKIFISCTGLIVPLLIAGRRKLRVAPWQFIWVGQISMPTYLRDSVILLGTQKDAVGIIFVPWHPPALLESPIFLVYFARLCILWAGNNANLL